MGRPTRITQYRGVEDPRIIIEVRKYKSRSVRAWKSGVKRKAFLTTEIKWEPITMDEVLLLLSNGEIVPL